MSSSGPNSPGTGADDSAVGSFTWSSPSAIGASDDSPSICGPVVASGASHYLKATNFGFSITGTIDGVVVEIERKRGGATSVKDAVVKLVVGGSVVGTNKADTSTEWPTSDTYASYGGAADVWGATLTDTAVSASDFGVVLQTTFVKSGKAAPAAYVDHIRITVYYTAGGAAGQPTSKRFGGVPFMGAHGAGLQAPVRQWIRRASGLLTPQFAPTQIWRPAHGID